MKTHQIKTTALALLTLAGCATSAWADAAIFGVTVGEGQTGVISGRFDYTLLGHVHANVYQVGGTDVAWMSYYQNVGTSSNSMTNLGVYTTIDYLGEGSIAWSISGLPPGEYFLTYGGGEPLSTMTTFDAVNPLVDLLFYFYGSDPANIVNPAGVPLGTLLYQMQSYSYAITYAGDPTSLINPTFSGWAN